MPKAVRLNLNKPVLLALILTSVWGCVRDAPSLPQGWDAQKAPPQEFATDNNRLTRCETLSSDIATWRGEIQTIEQVMRGSRTNDQVAGYLSVVLFPPLALAIDQQRIRKKELDDRQSKIDQALTEQHHLACPQK